MPKPAYTVSVTPGSHCDCLDRRGDVPLRDEQAPGRIEHRPASGPRLLGPTRRVVGAALDVLLRHSDTVPHKSRPSPAMNKAHPREEPRCPSCESSTPLRLRRVEGGLRLGPCGPGAVRRAQLPGHAASGRRPLRPDRPGVRHAGGSGRTPRGDANGLDPVTGTLISDPVARIVETWSADRTEDSRGSRPISGQHVDSPTRPSSSCTRGQSARERGGTGMEVRAADLRRRAGRGPRDPQIKEVGTRTRCSPSPSTTPATSWTATRSTPPPRRPPCRSATARP